MTAHLSDGVTNASLWSDSYEREFSHIFAIQSDIALKVAQALKAELLPAERERIARAPTTSLQAYELYLSATTRQTRDTPEETALAIAEVEQALSLDPNFALAWVLNANLRTVAQFYDPANAAEHQRVGEQSARRALEIDPNLGDAHGALGFALFLMKDWVGGEAAFRNAVELNVPVGNLPSYAVLQLGVANFAYARDILQEHRSTLPQNPIALRFLMMANALLGDWPAAEAGYAFGMRVFAPWRQSENHMMHLRVGRNELDEARAISPEGPVNAAMIANLEHPQSALEALHETYRDPSAAGSPNTRRDIALWAAYFGDARLAVDAMRSAVTEQVGQAMYIWLPQFAHVRQLPEFRTLLRDIGIVAYWEQFGWPTICRPRGGGDFECS